jgi:hypothetical protein
VRVMPFGSPPARGFFPRRRHAAQRRAGARFRYPMWAGAAALVGVSVLLAPAALAAAGWTVVPVPPTSGTNTELNGVAVLSSTNAWAVGQQFGAAGAAPPPPVTYRWNGTTWSLITTPDLGVNSALLGVSASTATDAWAVGFEVLGHHQDSTLLEHWNGTAWSVNTSSVSTGFGARLTGVVDLSPGNAWAVGEGATGALLEHWNGSTWSTVPLPDTGFSAGSGESLSASSASDIWLAGTSVNATTGATVAEALHYNGITWSVVAMQQPGTNTPTIAAVTDISAGNAWAVGQDIGATSAPGGSTLIEHWNGAAWSIVPSPTPGAYPGLTGVAGRGASDVYAVGSNLPSINGGVTQGMILRWNGSTWTVDTDPTAGTFSPLYGAATLPGVASEWAVGINSANQGLVLSHG